MKTATDQWWEEALERKARWEERTGWTVVGFDRRLPAGFTNLTTGRRLGRKDNRHRVPDGSLVFDHVHSVRQGRWEGILTMPYLNLPLGEDVSSGLSEWCRTVGARWELLGEGWWHEGTLAILVVSDLIPPV